MSKPDKWDGALCPFCGRKLCVTALYRCAGCTKSLLPDGSDWQRLKAEGIKSKISVRR